MASACPLCETRKGRRACPAKGVFICSHCCGTKRMALIDCPADCVYLQGGTPGWSRETEKMRDARRLLVMLEGLGQTQEPLLFRGLMGLVSIRARHRSLDDRMLASALAALRKTTETRLAGLLYDHPPDDLRAAALVREVSSLFEAEDPAGRRAAPDDRDLLAVLKALEAGLGVHGDGSPTSFLDTVVRVVGRQAGPAADPQRLIS